MTDVFTADPEVATDVLTPARILIAEVCANDLDCATGVGGLANGSVYESDPGVTTGAGGRDRRTAGPSVPPVLKSFALRRIRWHGVAEDHTEKRNHPMHIRQWIDTGDQVANGIRLAMYLMTGAILVWLVVSTINGRFS